MAMFNPSTSSASSPWNLQDERPPEGSFIGKIIDIKDEFGVVRPKFENPSETETVDRTIFLFGFRDQSGNPHRVASRWMKISGNEKSALYQFLRSAMGKPFPYGNDYTSNIANGGMLGRECLITINLEKRKNGSGTYPVITTVSPVPAGLTQAHQAAPQHAPTQQIQQQPVQPTAPLAPTGTEDSDPLPF